MDANVQSLGSIPETNITLYVNCLNIKILINFKKKIENLVFEYVSSKILLLLLLLLSHFSRVRLCATP